MKSSSDKKNRIFSLFLLAASLALFGYAGYDYYKTNYAKEYALRALNESSKNIPPPSLPDISGYTMEALEKSIPAPQKGNVEIIPLAKSTLYPLTSFGREMNQQFSQMQQVTDAVGIEIKSGVYTMAELADTVANPAYIEKTNNLITLKIPLFVHPGAALIIRGQKENRINIHLGTDGGSFISVFGKLYTSDANITGWNLAKDLPSTYVSKELFRPFLVFWSNSEGYMGRSSFMNLGYSFPKMYGMSFSSSIEMTRKNPNITRAKGWLIDSLVQDLYYGFYSYEASDIAILRNEYKDNVIYGIDPHDRSSRLIIAYNNSYGAKKRHGIIVSREVDDSWIFNNHTHNNHGSGIMIDRNSVRNVIANNLSERNGNDGLVFFESPNNISYANTLRNNGKAGIRIRNSWDIKILEDKIHDNKGYALLAYTTSLEENDSAKETRDTKLDPYGMRVSFDVNKIELNNNFAGNFNLMNVERAGFYDVNVFKAHSGYFEGDSALKNLQFTLYQSSSYGEKGIELYQLNYTPRYSAYWGKTGAHK